jgi:hypothetical protein
MHRIATFDKSRLFDVNGSDWLINNGKVPREKEEFSFYLKTMGNLDRKTLLRNK